MDLNVTPALSEPVPLRVDEDGVVRVGDTRVTLETVVTTFDQGAAPDDIVRKYPSLTLADVYATITYYLRHQSEVRAYVEQCRRDAEQALEEDERRYGMRAKRERVLARRSATR